MPQANPLLTLIRTLGSPPVVHSSSAAEHQRSHRSAVLCFQAHTDLVTKLTLLKAHRIAGLAADVADIEVRGEHLHAVLQAVAEYVLIVIEDTNKNVALGTIDAKDIENMLSDLTSEIVGSFAICARRTGENQECRGGSVS